MPGSGDMGLDVITLVAVVGLVHMIQVAVFAYQRAVNREMPGVGWWLAWSAAEAAGFGAMSLRGVPGLLTAAILAQNTLIVLGLCFMYLGLAKFFGRGREARLACGIYAAYWAGMAFFLFARDSVTMRGVAVSGGLAAFALASARLLWREERRRALASPATALCAVLGAHGLFHVLRAAGLFAGWVSTDVMARRPENTILYMDGIFAGMAFTYGLVLLVNRRLTGEARDAQEKMELVFNASPDAAVITRIADGAIAMANEGFEVHSGHSRAEAAGKTTLELGLWKKPEERQAFVETLRRNGRCENYEATFCRKDGTWYLGLISGKVLEIGGEPHAISVIRDITERRQAEEQRKKLEAQLMEDERLASIERLAGGVAHDFNNRLQAIMGFSELMMDGLAEDNPNRSDLKAIRDAAHSASELTKQLTAFARRQLIKPVAMDLNREIGGLMGTLRSLAGPNVAVEWKPGEGAGAVMMDPAQLRQVLLTLCGNACEAMDGRGLVVVETAKEKGARGEGQVRITVRDTGPGITAEHLPHVFEPFFSTKRTGRGLGLAAVYGVVKQNRGRTAAESPPGQGAAFHVWLPACAEAAGAAADLAAESGATARGRGETILIVDDEPGVLETGQRRLQRLGYEVLAAGSARVALDMVRRHEGAIDLLLTDVIMPEMNGPELVRQIGALRPGTKSLYMSGYTADQLAADGVMDKNTRVLPKPFTNESLAAEIRRALGD